MKIISLIILTVILSLKGGQLFAQCNVTVNPTSAAICLGSSVVLTASDTVNWYPSTGLNSIYGKSVVANPTVTTTYFFWIGNCTFKGQVTVKVNALPNVFITGIGTICNGQSSTFTAVSPGNSYLWSTNATTQSINVAAAGDYSVTVTDGSGCTATAIKTLTVNSIPPFSINGPSTICTGQTALLNAGPGYTNYIWSTGATTSSVNVSASGIYTVTVTSQSGCTASATKLLSVDILPVASIIGDTSFCQGSSAVLTASGNGSYLWSTGATTSTINVNSTGNYSVTVSNACGSSSSSKKVTAIPSGASITSNGPTSFCSGGSVLLTASGGNYYLWSTGETTSSITVTTSGNYLVTVSQNNNCSSTASQNVTVYPLPAAIITANGPTTFCTGGSVTLNANGGSNYLWSNGATTASITITASGNYFVTVTDSNNCSSITSQSIIVDTFPNATITPDGPTSFCSGGSVTLMASGSSSFIWSTGATTNSILVSQSGTYSVTVNNSCGSSSTSQLVNVNPNPVVTIIANAPTTFCTGDSVILTANGAVNFLWSTAATTASIIVAASGNYFVTGTDNFGCSATTSQLIDVQNFPTASITASGPLSFCDGDSVVLTASGGSSFLWSNGTTVSVITVKILGTYSVTVSNTCGSSSATVNISVSQKPIAIITANGPTNFCTGGNVALTASGGTNYLWSTGVTTTTINANTLGIYVVTVSNNTGCSATASQAVDVQNFPIASINTVESNPFCDGDSLILIAAGGSNFIWSNGTTVESLTVKIQGTYSVTVTNTCGNSSASIYVSVNPTPTATISASGPTNFCTGSSVILTASGGGNYLWSNGATDQSVSVIASGLYAVTISNSFNCSANTSKIVLVDTVPIATITPGGQAGICSGDSINLTASGGSSYLWSTGATSSFINVNLAGIYTVTVSNACGFDSASVTLNTFQGVAINPVSDGIYCNGENVTGSTFTSVTNASYYWYSLNNLNIGFGLSGNDSIPSYIANNVGNTSVTDTIIAYAIVNGCAGPADTFLITVKPTPLVNSTANQNYCNGDSINAGILFSSATPFSSFEWNSNLNVGFGSSGQGSIGAFVATNTYYYPVYATVIVNAIALGCTGPDSIFYITVNPTPTVNLVPDIIICNGTTISNIALSSGSPDSLIYWSCNNQSIGLDTNAGINFIPAFIAMDSSGTNNFSVFTIYAVSNGCKGPETNFTINVESVPFVTISGIDSASFCNGDSLILAANGNGNFIWSTGESTSNIYIKAGGTYTVTVTNSCGSSSVTKQVVETQNPIGSITASGSTVFCNGDSITLTASGGTDYFWSSGETTDSITVYASGNYFCLVSNGNSCIDSVSMTVDVENFPIAAITSGGPTTFCQGDSVTLFASGGSSYVWSTGQTTTSIAVDSAASYSVTVTNTCGSSSTSMLVAINPSPAINITASGPTVFCQGDSVTLIANGSTNYFWSTGDDTDSIVVTTSGIYTVTTYNSFDCSTTASQIVTVDTLPVAVITAGGPTTFCLGDSVVLTASGGSSFVWSTGATSASIKVDSAAAYFVIVTNSCGSSSTSQNIVVDSLPIPIISANGPTVYCTGGNVSLTASGGISYLWSTGDDTPVITVSEAGIYFVTVTNSSNCSAAASQIVTVDTLPVAVITTGGPITFCQGDSVALTANGGSSYLWSNGETTQTIVVNAAGSYSVSAINSCGSDSAFISISISQGVSVNPISDTVVCNGETISGLAFTSSPVAGYYWHSLNNLNIGFGLAGNDSIPSYVSNNLSNISITDTLIVWAIYNGCAGLADTFLITVKPSPKVNSVANLNLCNGEVVGNGIAFTSSVTLATINWSSSIDVGFGLSGQGNIPAFVAANNLFYPVTATIIVTAEALGCTGPDSVFFITVNPTPQVDAISDIKICSGAYLDSILLSSSSPNAQLHWSCSNTNIGIGNSNGTDTIPGFIATNSTMTAQTGIFSVYASANGCTGDTIVFNITVNPIPVINPTNDTSYCSGTLMPAIVFSGNPSGATYYWSSNHEIGLNSFFGTGSIPSATAIEITTLDTISSTFTVFASFDGCVGVADTFIVSIYPVPPLGAMFSDLPPGDSIICNGSTNLSFFVNYLDSVHQVSWSLSPSNAGEIKDSIDNYSVVSFNSGYFGLVALTASVNYFVKTGGCATKIVKQLYLQSGGVDSIFNRIVFKKEPGHILIYPDNSLDSYQWGYDTLIVNINDTICGPPVAIPKKVYQFFVPDEQFIKNDSLNIHNYAYWVLIRKGDCISKVYYNGPFAHKIIEDVQHDDGINISINPNPNNGNFNLLLNGKIYGDINVRIINALGQTVFKTDFQKKIPETNQTLNLVGLNNGIYMVQIQASDLNTITTRLIIQK